MMGPAYKLVEVLRNPLTHEIRVVFKRGILHFVVKTFDAAQQERWTCKVFSGMYDAVKSRWRTLEPIESSVNPGLGAVKNAIDVLQKTARAFGTGT